LEGLTVSPPDLEIRVRIDSEGGKRVLNYLLHSASGTAEFHFQDVRGPELTATLEGFAQKIFDQIEKLHEGLDIDEVALEEEEAIQDLESLGRGLYRMLFSAEMKALYRRFHKTVRTLQITTMEAAIPWELVKPFDDSDLADVIDDDFLCIQFQLTRWLAGAASPRPHFPLRRLACIGDSTSASGLKHATAERQLLADMAQRHPGVEDSSPPRTTFASVKGLFAKGEIDLYHFVGHGDFDIENPAEAKIELTDRPFRARHLSGPLQTRMREDRPFVFFSACRTGRQGTGLAGLEGWARVWIEDCECGAFLGPLWLVKDSAAFEHARVLYTELENGKTLGEASLAARAAVRQLDASRPNWLAFAVYGHPNARLTFPPKIPATPPDPPAVKSAPLAKAPRSRRSGKKEANRARPQRLLAALPDPDPRQESSKRPEARSDYAKGPTPGEERIHPGDGTILVFVPGGTFTLGAEGLDRWSRPVHRVRLSPFWIGKFPVTNEQFERFLAANPACSEPAFWDQSDFNLPQHPVVGVSWEEAEGYCRWAGLELPTEAQWEAAARGSDQRLYPWGGEPPTPLHANFAGTNAGTTPVTAYPGGRGPYGTFDQAGNVWEWCADPWVSNAYELIEEAQWDPIAHGDTAVRVLRGGSWMNPAQDLHAAYRDRRTTKLRFKNQGFRCLSRLV